MKNDYLKTLCEDLKRTGLFRIVTPSLLSHKDFIVSIWDDHVRIIPMIYSSSLSIDSEIIDDRNTMTFYFKLLTRSSSFDEIATKHENYRIGMLINRM